MSLVDLSERLSHIEAQSEALQARVAELESEITTLKDRMTALTRGLDVAPQPAAAPTRRGKAGAGE